jgi:ribosomal protein L37AE/L43A
METIIEGYCPMCRQWRVFRYRRAGVWQCKACGGEALLPPGYETIIKPEHVIDVKAKRD